jgi:hypothetical protein
MKKVSKLVLSAAVVGVFAGCGGGDDGIDLGALPSVAACYSVPKTVNYKLKSINAPSNLMTATHTTIGPMTYKGQAVIGQTFFFPDDTANINYWTVTSSGVKDVADVNYLGVETIGDIVLPPNMTPGQTIKGTARSGNNTYTYSNTLLKFEEVTLADKTFPNTCLIRIENSRENGVTDAWYAPGYGRIKQVGAGWTSQYDGDL